MRLYIIKGLWERRIAELQEGSERKERQGHANLTQLPSKGKR